MNRLQGWGIPVLTTCLVHGAIILLPVNFGSQKEEMDAPDITFRLVALPQKSSPSFTEAMPDVKEPAFLPKKKPAPPKNFDRKRLAAKLPPKTNMAQPVVKEEVSPQESSNVEEAQTDADIAAMQPGASSTGTEQMPTGPVVLSTELSVICPDMEAPAYPQASRRLGEYGDVVLKLEVDENGLVHVAKVVDSSGYNRLDKAAIEAIKNWRCKPPQRNGQSVRAIALQPFSFVLQ